MYSKKVQLAQTNKIMDAELGHGLSDFCLKMTFDSIY